ncbi:aldolase-type TIM barrel [Purpureocillium lavendulum]|uniref:Aldolase-type TIM barrel n=1 Tax=Purpureocillium lavendulum TaxID=1247861 RepID=A0AB34FJK8_9HYPO|nr:aldolase-type TIM barrel [Purpureocillium lavendulum]
MAKSPPSGVYAPLPAFFNDADELGKRRSIPGSHLQRINRPVDVKSFVQHGLFVAKPGVIPVVSATMGEAAHLDREERIQLIQALRAALNKHDLHETPIVAGVGATSTRETIRLAQGAAAAGAEFVLVIAPGYFSSALKADPAAIRRFFTDVAAQSPVPVIIYNFPVVAGGIDLTSDDVVEIAKAAPNLKPTYELG